MRADIDKILGDLETLNSARAFKAKFESVWASLGFGSYSYASMDTEDLETGRYKEGGHVIYLSNVKPVWVQRYVEEAYADHDPLVKDCLSARLPLQWTENYRANSLSARETEMMNDAKDIGLRKGLVIPIHGPRGELGIFSLYSDLEDGEFTRLTATTKYEAQVLAYHLHDAACRVLATREAVPMPIPLTDREVEILRWTAAGKTAWEIGSILSISERTVNFHVQNVMEKFGVHNKTHAAAKAMGMGLFAL